MIRCGNGTIRTEYPVELFGEDWFDWLMEKERAAAERIGGLGELFDEERPLCAPWDSSARADHVPSGQSRRIGTDKQ
jgi:hypothetical protein